MLKMFEKKAFYNRIMRDLIVEAGVDYREVFSADELNEIKDEVYTRVSICEGSEYDFGALFMSHILRLDKDFIRLIPVSHFAMRYLENNRMQQTSELILLAALSDLSGAFNF